MPSARHAPLVDTAFSVGLVKAGNQRIRTPTSSF